jgi:LacI family transcriptional regulator
MCADVGEPHIRWGEIYATGVSSMTVSRVVNGNGYVSAKTKRQVESAIAALGYRPNALAKGMRTNSTRSVGLILPSLINAIDAGVAQATEQFFARHGYPLVLGITGFSPDLEAQFQSSFQQNTVDGVIAILGDETLHRIRDLVQQSLVPIVVVDRDVPFPTDTVFTEHRRCMGNVVTYLSGLGHRRIALPIPPLTIRPGHERHAAFMEAMRQAGLPLDPSLIWPRQELSTHGYQATLELLNTSRRPSAIVMGACELT